jgi:hypothetical protein
MYVPTVMTFNNADMPSLPQSRTNLIVKELAGELLVYDERSTKAFCLNESAAAIWGMCDGKTSVSEMTQRVAPAFGGVIDEGFIAFALAGFRENGLLENESVGALPVARLTRAELVSRVGRVGLAAAAAVPLVTSIVAPTAAKAYGRSGGENVQNGTDTGDTDVTSHDRTHFKRGRHDK